MDLKFPSGLASAKPTPGPARDLLTQLRAAGTIEAEVVRLLDNNQLLLHSRLGQILARNTLAFKAGDRINLRLDVSSGQPVLKASPLVPEPIRLDSREYPGLAKALPPERPVLARISRVLAQRTEIRLAERSLQLPRRLALPDNQLLSLQRRDSQRSIEIRPLENRAIYKAILTRLLPREAHTREPGLVRLLQLAASAPGKPETGVKMAAAGAHSRLVGAAGEPGDAFTNRPTPPAVKALADRINVETRNQPAPTGRAATPSPLPSAAANATRGTVLTTVRTDAAASTEPGRQQIRADAGDRQAQNPVPGKFGQRGDPVSASARSATAGTQDSPAPAKFRQQPAAAPTLPAAPAAWTAATSLPSLRPLLQFVGALAEIDAPQIRKWFEFARLVRAAPGTGALTPSGDIFRLLQPLADAENLSRELGRALRQSAADGDAATSRTVNQEMMLPQARETARLAEQSLGQNLLQRAILGLQQETQQPLTLSLALPFVEQQRLGTLYIDLEQRKQARSEAERSWELRLSFELGELGAIACHLLLEGITVAASFYSEDEATCTLIETELPRLRRQLSQAGFDTGEFHSFSGRPAPTRRTDMAGISESLIDIEA